MTTLHNTIRILLAGSALSLLWIAPPSAMGGEDRADRPAKPDVAVKRDSGARTEPARDANGASSRVVYRPPRTGSPTPDHRIGGATRGGTALASVTAIAPDHEGLTARGQPELCWHLDMSDRELPIMFTLIESDAIGPLVERRLASPAKPGIQVIRLSDYGVELEVGRRYEWSVSIVPDPEHRSHDLVATGVIRRVAPPSNGVAQAWSGSDPMHALRISAGAGLWYDAVATLVEMIEAAPLDGGLRREWAGLLEQVRLADPASRAVASRAVEGL